MCWRRWCELIRVFNLCWNTLLQKKSAKKKCWRVLHQKKSLFYCISPIMATNRQRKKKCHPLKSAICLWQMCITGGVIFFIVRSYINAETEKYQFNCRKNTDSCYHQRQLITQSLRKLNLCKLSYICVVVLSRKKITNSQVLLQRDEMCLRNNYLLMQINITLFHLQNENIKTDEWK